MKPRVITMKAENFRRFQTKGSFFLLKKFLHRLLLIIDKKKMSVIVMNALARKTVKRRRKSDHSASPRSQDNFPFHLVIRLRFIIDFIAFLSQQ